MAGRNEFLQELKKSLRMPPDKKAIQIRPGKARSR